MTRPQRTAGFLFSIFAACTLSPHALAQVHPIVGTWEWTRSVNNCKEVYDYKPDGTLHVISGEELTEATYEVTASPDGNGFHHLTGRTTRTNGAKDCSDEPSGALNDEPYTIFIIFHPTQPFHLACYKPSLDQCFGPLRRVDVRTRLPNDALQLTVTGALRLPAPAAGR